MNNVRLAVILLFGRLVDASRKIMKSYRPTLAFVCLTFGFCCLAPSAHATSNYSYKPNEYVVVNKGGRSPNEGPPRPPRGAGVGFGPLSFFFVERGDGEEDRPIGRDQGHA